MSTLNTKTINDLLAGKQKSTSFFDNVETKRVSAEELYVLNNQTVLGAEVLKNDQGYITVTVNDNTAVDGYTKGVLVQIGNQTAIYPVQSEGIYDIDVSTGDFLIVDSDLQVTEYVLDSAGGEPLEDSSGNLVTQLVSAGTVPVVKSTGTDVAQSLPNLTESLTGIIPPAEPLAIIALGGAAVSEITNTIKVASERKKTLMDSIKDVASSASLDGLGSSITEGIDDVKGKLDNVISKDITKDITDAVSAVEDVIDETVNNLSTAIDDAFAGVVSEITDATNDLINHITPKILTGGGFVQDLFESLTGDVGSTLQGIFGSSFDINADAVSNIIQDVIDGSLGKATKTLALLDKSLSKKMRDVIENTPDRDDPAAFRKSVIQKAKSADISNTDINAFQSLYTNIETALNSLDTTIAGKLVSEVGEFYTEDTDLADLIKRYIGADTKEFTYVSSKEELGLEFYRMTRSVSEMIIHATETYTNANIGSEEIHLRHLEAEQPNGIQYHYVIRRDGRLQRGMPLDKTGNASNKFGHKENAVDVVLVGGVNVPSDADNPLENLSAQSFTQVQMKTLELVMEAFYQHMPGAQIFGHNAIDENNEDPYFDVISFVENKFGKKSVYKDLLTEQSLSAKDLVNKRPI